MNKRDFIVAGSALAVGSRSAFADEAAPAARTAKRPPPLDGRQRRAAWQRYIGHDFGAGGSRLRLLRIEPAAHRSPGLDQFTLVFALPAAADLGAGTHELLHPSGQRLALYLESPAAGETRAHFSLLS